MASLWVHHIASVVGFSTCLLTGNPTALLFSTRLAVVECTTGLPVAFRQGVDNKKLKVRREEQNESVHPSIHPSICLATHRIAMISITIYHHSAQGARSTVMAALMLSGFGFRAAWSTWVMWKYITVARAAVLASNGALPLIALDPVAGILCGLNYVWFGSVVRSAAKVVLKRRSPGEDR